MINIYIIAFFIIFVFGMVFCFKNKKPKIKPERIDKSFAKHLTSKIRTELEDKCPENIIDYTFKKINDKINSGDFEVCVDNIFDNIHQENDFVSIFKFKYGFNITKINELGKKITYKINWEM